MNVGDERSRSLWMDVDVAPGTSKLTQDAECDTVVIGSGIAGLSTAYELSGQGQKVIVLDRGRIGSGMTARTTAHLSANNDDGFKTMIDRRGEKLAQDFYVSQAASITRIETIQSSESIDCDFRRVDGFLFPGPQTEQSEIDEEHKASQAAGMPVDYANGVPLTRSREHALPALSEPGDVPSDQVSARARALHQGARRPAVRRYGRDRRGGGRRRCRRQDRGRANRPRQARGRRHQFADQRSRGAAFQAGAVPHLCDGAAAAARQAAGCALLGHARSLSLCAAAARTRTFDYLIVGGADHKSGEADDAEIRYEALEAWIRNLVPDARRRDPPLVRTGARHDRLFVVQRTQSRQRERLCAHRRFRPGHHPWRGRQPDHRAHDHAGRELWQELYGPERKTASALSTFISENLTAVKNLRRIRRARRGRLVRRDRARPGRHRPAGLEEGRGLSRRERRPACVLGRLHPSRLPSALEFVRALLGLPVPRLAVRHRRRGAERPGDSSARGRGGRLEKCAQ